MSVAPTEVEGALQYATKYAPFTVAHKIDGDTVHTLTGVGLTVAVIALAVFVAINLGFRQGIGLGRLAVLLSIDAIVSPADTGLIYITVTSRIA